MRALFLLFLLRGYLLASQPAYVITLIPYNSTFPHWKFDDRTHTGFIAKAEIQFTAPFKGSMEYAACSISNPGQKWRIPAFGNDGSFFKDLTQMKQGGGYGGGIYFPSTAPSAGTLDALGDGTYLFAVLIDGVRCSNVIRIIIKHDYDATKEPLLRVFPVQPFTGNEIKCVGVWVAPSIRDDKLTNEAASTIDLSIDSKWHTPQAEIWTGPVYRIEPGTSTATGWLLNFYEPPIASFQHAKVQARLLGHTSEVTDLSVNFTDARQFDHAFGL